MTLKIGLALAAFTLAASPALARDYFVGDYASKVGAWWGTSMTANRSRWSSTEITILS